MDFLSNRHIFSLIRCNYPFLNRQLLVLHHDVLQLNHHLTLMRVSKSIHLRCITTQMYPYLLNLLFSFNKYKQSLCFYKTFPTIYTTFITQKYIIMDYKNLFYFDIETVSKYRNLIEFEDNDKRGFDLFLKKLKRKSDNYLDWKDEPAKVYVDKSPLMPEYGKIVCVTMAYYKNDKLKMKSVYDDDEKKLVTEVHKNFDNISRNTTFGSCGYYIKGFDIPWLCKKMMKYELKIPTLLKTFGVKPWDMNVFDLAEIWRSSGTLENVSFDEMLHDLDVVSPKDDISGEDVNNVYWRDGDLERVKDYCEKDVIACVDAAKKLSNII